jgi:hypothetical protein
MAFKIKPKKEKMKSYVLRTGKDVNVIKAKNRKDLDRKLKDGVFLWNYTWEY